MAERARTTAPTRDRGRGFTLLEMVVAIAIFALMAAMAHVSLVQFLSARETLAASNESLRHLQRAFTLLENDIRFMLPRVVRDGIGEPLDALMLFGDGTAASAELFEFTTSFPGIVAADRHRIRRVGWSLDEGVLVRRVWPVLDRDFDSAPRQSRVVTGVRSVEVGFYGIDPDSRQVRRLTTWEDPARLPLGLEIVVTLDDASAYRRVIEVAGDDI